MLRTTSKPPSDLCIAVDLYMYYTVVYCLTTPRMTTTVANLYSKLTLKNRLTDASKKKWYDSNLNFSFGSGYFELLEREFSVSGVVSILLTK